MNLDPAQAGATAGGIRNIRLWAVVALIVALWVLQHPYAGIFHDAQLYTIQALAHASPSDLAGDVFLRLGSQDRFTLFGPLYGGLIRIMGAAPAAALLTFLFQAAFAIALVLLARRVLSPDRVWLGVGLVLVVPFTYGARKVFFLMEDFVTPRLLAEALVVAGLAAFLHRRHWLAAVLAALAAVMHPIIAMTGIGVAMFIDPNAPRRTGWWVLVGAALIAGVVFLAIRATPLRFDEDWWSMIHSGLPYLFPLEWRKVDWARVVVVATTLYAGIRWLPDGPARALCRAALLTAVAGLALSIVFGDLLRLVLFVQMQPWRVMWIASLIALMLSPVILAQMWRSGTLARTAVVALLAAFLLADERFAVHTSIVAAILVLITFWVRQEPPALRMVFAGMVALLVLAAVINLTSSVIVARARIDDSAVPEWLRELRALTGTGVLPAAVLLGCGWLLARARPAIWAAVGAAGTAAAILFALSAFPQWSSSQYSPTARAAFQDWRARIPPRTEVLWFENPVATWILLDRPNYASQPQTASVLFSREAAMVLRERMSKLDPFIEFLTTGDEDKGDASPAARSPRLAEICAAADVRFIVTRRALDVMPAAAAPDAAAPAFRDANLYECTGIQAGGPS